MKIVSWNVNHRASEKKIPKNLADGILSLSPDIVILTEFVLAKSRDQFIKDLVNYGLVHIRTSNFVPGENSIFVASNVLLNNGSIKAPLLAPSIPTNFYHLELPTKNLHLIAIRIPDYSKFLKIKRTYWDWLIEMAKSFEADNCLMIGDFNTSPLYAKSRCGDKFQQLADVGWRKVSPETGNSYWTPKGVGVQIDHAFMKGAFDIVKSEFIEKNNDYYFVGRNCQSLSDHAVLCIEIKEAVSGHKVKK